MDRRRCYRNGNIWSDYEGVGPVLSSEKSGDMTLHGLEQDKTYKRDNLICDDYISILCMPNYCMSKGMTAMIGTVAYHLSHLLRDRSNAPQNTMAVAAPNPAAIISRLSITIEVLHFEVEMSSVCFKPSG
jgi:hypothetical protein